MQEKTSQNTTNGSSTIVQGQTQAQIASVNKKDQIVSGLEGVGSNVDVLLIKGETNEGEIHSVYQQQFQDHQYTGDEFNQEYEKFHDEHQIFENQIQGYDPKDFERFNDADTSKLAQTIPQEVYIKSVLEQKLPIKNEILPKAQQQSAKNQQATKNQVKPVQEKKQDKTLQKRVNVEKKSEDNVPKKEKLPQTKRQIKQNEPLPVIKESLPSEKKQTVLEQKKQQPIKTELSKKDSSPSSPKKEFKPEGSQNTGQQQEPQRRDSQIQGVSSIILPPSISAGQIIFQAQRQRIGTTLDLFLKFTAKHQKHIKNQKQLIGNVQDEIQKRRISKTPLMNTLRDYFENFVSLCRDLYERSYKFTKSDKPMSANPMINMRQELKGGIDEMIFLRKATGNQYNRLGEFITTNITKNVIKIFTEYWSTVCAAQTKHKEKRQQFSRKEKQFLKRINKVVKVYTKGKQGSSQEEDLFIQMTKFINQEKQFRTCLIDYGTGLIPLKKSFIKAEQTLHEELQHMFNTYKNQFRVLFGIHPKQFTQIQKMEKLIRDNSTFEKLSDITDGDYVRSVLVTLEKGSIQNLTDKEFEKVLNMLHFEEIVGNSVQLLKGTTTKSFELKNKAQQVIDTVSGNLLIFNREIAQMKEKFIIKNIDARIVQEGVVQIDQTLKGIIFDSHRTVRVTFRDNDRAEELICFLNQVHENLKQQQLANNKK